MPLTPGCCLFWGSCWNFSHLIWCQQLRGQDRSPDSSSEVLYQPYTPVTNAWVQDCLYLQGRARGFAQSCACFIEVLILKKKDREWILGDIWQILPFGRKVIEWNLAWSQPCSIEIIKQVIWIRIVHIIINSDIYEIHLLPCSQASHWEAIEGEHVSWCTQSECGECRWFCKSSFLKVY